MGICKTCKGKKMKKTLFALIAFIGLSACAGSYDYYDGNVRYYQDGEDCIFYSTESGYRYSHDIRSLDTDKKIVYRNTMCRDLYAQDNINQPSRTERQVLTPVEKKDCACKSSCIKTKKYVFVK